MNKRLTSFEITIKEHGRNTPSRATSGLNLWISFVLFTHTEVYIIYHHSLAHFRVRRPGKGMFPADQGSDDWPNTSKLALQLLNHTQSTVKYRIQFLELLVFLTFTVQALTEKN